MALDVFFPENRKNTKNIIQIFTEILDDFLKKLIMIAWNIYS